LIQRQSVFAIFSFGLSSLCPAIPIKTKAASNECQSEIQELLQQHETTRHHLSREQRNELTTLRVAAGIASKRGHDEACEEIGEVLETWLSQSREQMVVDGVVLTLNEEQKRERLAAARPIGKRESLLRFRELVGLPVSSPDGQDLSEAEDILIDKMDRAHSYIVVGYGRILGIGEDYRAVPASLFSIMRDEGTLVLDISDERLSGAPEIVDFENSNKKHEWIWANNAYFATEETRS